MTKHLTRRVERLVIAYAERGVTVSNTAPDTRRVLTPVGWLKFFENHAVPAVKGTDVEEAFTTLLSIFKEALAVSGGSPVPPEWFMPGESQLFRYQAYLACHHPHLSEGVKLMLAGLAQLPDDKRQRLHALASAAQRNGPDVVVLEAQPRPRPSPFRRVARAVHELSRDPLDQLLCKGAPNEK